MTGGPGSGKTTTVNLLTKPGYNTTIERARHSLDTQRAVGHRVAEVRSHQREFQLGVLEMKFDREASLSPEDIVFLDRAVPDAFACYRILNLEPDARLLDALRTVSYKKVFVVDMLPLVRDYARTEDEADQKRIHELLVEAYEKLQFPVIRLPVLPPEERVDFILPNL